MEEIYSIPVRWFVRRNLDEKVWDATVFTNNRDRLLDAEVAKRFLALVVEPGPSPAPELRIKHFTVDGT